jgi:uncharacterized protein YndB with AHSA1/START domain
MTTTPDPDPGCDLVFTRLVRLPAPLLWRGWTEPALLTRWFTPAPWRTLDAEVDLRPGGIFRTVMQGPDGETHENLGCWLDVAPPRRLVWTDALLPGFRPAPNPFVTVTLTLEETAGEETAGEETAGGTRYTAWVQHKDRAERDRHAAMGFEEGWGKALDQLVAVLRAGA